MAHKWNSEFTYKKYISAKDEFPTAPDISFMESSVLVRAIRFENVKEIGFLLKKGSDPNKPVGKIKMRPLMIACFIKNDNKRVMTFKNLFHHNVDPELTDIQGHNSLMYVCALNLKKELNIILDNFICSFYNKDVGGNSLLHVCAKYSSVDVMDMVLEKMLRYSMNTSIRNGKGHTPLDVAVINKNNKCADRLLRIKGHGSLPSLANESSYFQHTKGVISQEAIAAKSALLEPLDLQEPIPASYKRVQTSSSCDRDLSLPPIFTDPIQTARTNQTSPFITSHTYNKTTPVRDPEEVVDKVLQLKSKTSPVDCIGHSPRVPLDTNWIATTQEHLQAIAATEKYVIEMTKNNKRAVRESVEKPTQEIIELSQKCPLKIWRKVLILSTATRSMASHRVVPMKRFMGEGDEFCDDVEIHVPEVLKD